MTSFLRSKLKGSTKSTPPVSNQSSFSEANDEDFQDASDEVIYAVRMASCGSELRADDSVGLGLKDILPLAQLCGCSCRSVSVLSKPNCRCQAKGLPEHARQPVNPG